MLAEYRDFWQNISCKETELVLNIKNISIKHHVHIQQLFWIQLFPCIMNFFFIEEILLDIID